MIAYSSATVMFMGLIGCFLCRSQSNLRFALAYSQHRPQAQSATSKAKSSELIGRREIFSGMAGLMSLSILPLSNANAAEQSVLPSKFCAYGEGSDCEDLAEGNSYIMELQRKSAANKQANIDSAKNAFYAKNYPDWFAAVGKTMVQKESDGTFIVVDSADLAKLWDDGKLKMSTPMTMGGKIKDVTQKPMLVLKE